jgi:Putative zinc-finger
MSDNRLITCEQLDERLSEWLDHDLDAGTRTALEQHAAGCARCAGLVDDLASIRRQAASLPELTPSRDLWPEIEARIQAPVISLETRVAPRRSRSTWWMGAAAAGLVAVTASVTYYATTRVDRQPTTVAVDPAVVRTPDTTQPEEMTEPEAALASVTQPGNAQREARPSGRAPRPSDVTEKSEYARDVAQLRAIVTQRRADLDSTTIAVLEKNLELIDRAIAESRAALQRDPASEFLADQLARAMTKKVAILRTAALLPARS